MHYHRLVVTAGTSVLLPPNLGRAWLEQQGADLVHYEGRKLIVRGEPRGTETEVLRRWARALPEVVDGKEVSAEYSALTTLSQHRRLGDSPHVTLIHSDTFDGKLAAAMVDRLIRRDFNAHVELRPVGDLDAEDPRRLHRSLGAFMHEVANALRGGHPSFTCFAPLGGYKVMTSLGYVAGAFLRFPTLYLHEASQVPHEVPWVPIRIDEQDLVPLASLVRRTVRGLKDSHLSETEQRQAQENPWLFERCDDLIVLNAFGQFLRQESLYRPIIGPRIRGSAQVLADCRGQERFVVKELEDLLQKLEEPFKHQAVLHHEVDFGHHGTAWSLFKGASGRKGVFRAVYRWTAAEDTLDLKKVWLEHHGYERQAGQRAFLESDEPELKDLNGLLN